MPIFSYLVRIDCPYKTLLEVFCLLLSSLYFPLALRLLELLPWLFCILHCDTARLSVCPLVNDYFL